MTTPYSSLIQTKQMFTPDVCRVVSFRFEMFLLSVVFPQNILPVLPSTLHHIAKMSSFEPPLNFHLSNVSDPTPT